jgi:tetraacyldisaccharide 4'-kinase
MRAPEFWTSSRPGAATIATLLSPFGALYGLSVRAEAALAQPYRAHARVVCVGNLTAGGSGKTPIAITLGRMLCARGLKVFFLTRGYGGRLSGPVEVDPTLHTAAEVGDEPLLLAPHAPVIVARNRAEGGRLADSGGADIIVMDDGLQNFQLAKDVSLVVIDAEAGFGNGRLIPAGPAARAGRTGSRARRRHHSGRDGENVLPTSSAPVMRAHLVPERPDALQGRKVFAFAGIGRPDKFFETLRNLGAELTDTRPFPDHHRFTPAELSSLRKDAQDDGAVLVTTEKDFVRLAREDRDGILTLPVRAAFTNETSLSRLLDRIAGTEGNGRT